MVHGNTWKEEWGDIRYFKASIIAERLGCTIEQARLLKLGLPVHVETIESEADNGGK
jgi:hypothetical protein